MGIDSSDSVVDVVREALVTGAAVVVPLVITFIVLDIVVNFLYNNLASFTEAVLLVPGASDVSRTVIDAGVVVFLAAIILVVGVVVERTEVGEAAFDAFDDAFGRVPGVGSIYDSFRQMSDVMIGSDAQNFRDVKIVEFPNEDVYTLGFLTTHTPESITGPTPHDEMETLFLPLAPNPVMGGHLVHVPTENVLDAEMTVEEAMQTVVTTGVALGGTGDEGLSQEELRDLAGGADGRYTVVDDIQ